MRESELVKVRAHIQDWEETGRHIGKVATNVLMLRTPIETFGLLDTLSHEAMDAQEALLKDVGNDAAWERAIRLLSMSYGLILLAVAEANTTLEGPDDP